MGGGGGGQPDAGPTKVPAQQREQNDRNITHGNQHDSGQFPMTPLQLSSEFILPPPPPIPTSTPTPLRVRGCRERCQTIRQPLINPFLSIPSSTTLPYNNATGHNSASGPQRQGGFTRAHKGTRGENWHLARKAARNGCYSDTSVPVFRKLCFPQQSGKVRATR